MNDKKTKFVLNLHTILVVGILLQVQFYFYGQNDAIPPDLNSTYNREINDLLAEGFKNRMFPGISVALYSNDSIHYFNYGYANLNQEISL